ncbi:MAG: CpsD/CapB family tyrosine-protein kinase [Acidobacteriota bacterium]|nr:CpsD/CapB family tyrosine-protein kinase [Acidobacteriota bacterium]
MGRVYEALKRAAESNGGHNKRADGDDNRRDPTTVDGNGTAARPNGQQHDPVAAHIAAHNAAMADALVQSSSILRAPQTAQVSASTEHTEQIVGSALPGGQASRDAGATLGAAGSTRTGEFVTVDISPARVEPHLVAITQPKSPHAERFRSLRTRVLHAGERKKVQAIVITSASVMEGKTVTSLNLSWLLAQTDGVRALLIDGDLRHPCAAEYLGIDAPVGLSEVLGEEATLKDSIICLEPAGLHLLPGGARRDDVAELLSGPKFTAVLAEARRMFDFIIIDAPPLGLFTDATVLINRADSALIVARSGKTRYAALERVLEPLPRERILGVVLNASQEDVPEEGYYYQRRDARQSEAFESRREADHAAAASQAVPFEEEVR